jgi:CRISPR-associated protein Cas2
MFVIFTYDVNAKRDAKVMKTCKKYLNHIQNSVFEGMISDAKLERLKSEVERIIDKNTDSVCIYKIGSIKYTSKERIGQVSLTGNIID